MEKFKDIIKNYEGKNFNDIDESDPNFNIIKLYVLTEYCIDARNLIRKKLLFKKLFKNLLIIEMSNKLKFEES